MELIGMIVFSILFLVVGIPALIVGLMSEDYLLAILLTLIFTPLIIGHWISTYICWKESHS